MVDPFGFIPEEVKRKLYDDAIGSVGRLTEKMLGDKAADAVKKLSSDGEFYVAFEKAIQNVASRFDEEYILIDEDLVVAIKQDQSFWQSKSILAALQNLVKRPGAFMPQEKETIIQHFDDVLPNRVNRDRVNKAVLFILKCLAEELWNLPALQPIYQLQFQRITAEKATDMVREIRGLRDDTRQTMIALVNTMGEQQKLIAASSHPSLPLIDSPKIYHRLHSPNYKFVGRQEELEEVLRILRPYPHSQYPLVTIDGIGGVGKTALALAVAYYYVREFENLDEAERFKAVVWTSAKKSILTPSGIVPSRQSLRNLGDIYSELAQTLKRPDILSARVEEQDGLVGNVLSNSRVLLIVDNLETVDDPKVMEFLRELPAPTKAIITTRMRVDGAVSVRLEGMQGNDTIKLIEQECSAKKVHLSVTEQEKLAENTAGVPLAIVWTVGQIDYGRSIDDAILALRSAGGDYAKFCFSESLELLQREHKRHAIRLLMGLALFADGATREALGFVCGLQDSKDMRDEGLADLTRLSLINYDGIRFSMLPLTKEFAIVELGKDLQFKEDATSRWFKWHILLTEQAGGGKTDLDESVLESLRIEHTNILWAIDSSFHHERFDIYVKLVRGMEFFWLSEHWREFERYLERARNLVPDMNDRIHFAARLVWLYVLREDFKKAEELLGYANKLLEEYPSPYEKMRIEDFTGQMYMEMDELDKAEEHLREALRLAQERPDRRGQFACLKYLGEVYCKRGDAETAKDLLKQAHPFAAGEGEDQWKRGLAHEFHLRGLISLVEKKWDEAVISFNASINDYLAKWPDARLLTKVKFNLAIAKYQLGQKDDARILLTENKSTFQKLGMHAKVDEMDKLLLEWQ